MGCFPSLLGLTLGTEAAEATAEKGLAGEGASHSALRMKVTVTKLAV